MKRNTFAFLASGLGIEPEEYEIFFAVSAVALAAAETVPEEYERRLMDWQKTHDSYVEYSLMCCRLWHRQELLSELMASYGAADSLSALQEVTERARERYSAHFMDDLTKLTTTIEIVIPDREYFTALSDSGLVTAPTHGMHLSVFQHVLIQAQREGLHLEILDSSGDA